MSFCPWCDHFQPPAGTCRAPCRVLGSLAVCGGIVCGACGRCQRNTRHQQESEATG